MIEETFTDVLGEYSDFVQKINTCFQEGDVAALKSAVHKIKPLFGFVGLTDIQSQCLQFENKCQGNTISRLAADYTHLHEKMTAARTIIEKEQDRLVKFNRNQ